MCRRLVLLAVNALQAVAGGFITIAIEHTVKQANKIKETYVGQVLTVLIETRKKTSPDTWFGFTPQYIKVGVKSSVSMYNTVVLVKLTKVEHDYVIGEIQQ